MNSVILQAAARLLTPLILLFSVFILLRGHDHSGGGFIGAITASAGFAFYNFAYGPVKTRKALMVSPITIVVTGLAVVVASGLIGLINDAPFLTAVYGGVYDPWPVSSALLFDIGIYLAGIGAITNLLLALEESTE